MTTEDTTATAEAENDIYDDDDELQEDKYLTFKVSSENYGMNVLDVVEILRMITITNIPESLDYIKGIINLRGKIIPVMNVRVRFGLDEIEYDDRTCIIVVSVKGVDIGLIVDAVAEVLEISEGQIDCMPSVSQGAHQKFIRGIGKIDDQVKILLDLEKLIGDEDIAAIQGL